MVRGNNRPLFGQRKGEIKENIHLGPDLKVFRRPTALWPQGLVTILRHPCVLSCHNPQARLWGNVPPGLVKIGCGAPVKHAGCGSGLISRPNEGTKRWSRTSPPWRHLDGRRSISESRVDGAISQMIILYFKALTKSIFLPLKVNAVGRPILRRGN